MNFDKSSNESLELTKSIEYLLKAERVLQTSHIYSNPASLSMVMIRISTYAGAVEEKLAEYEKNYEIKQADLYRQYLREEKLSPTAAEKQVKIALGELKGNIAYLSRIVSSAWKQVSTCQSRVSHLNQEWNTGKHL